MPTAVSISVLDVKLAQNDVNSYHACLSHYLIDGHHKIRAASELGAEITLLAFIAVEQGISNPEDIDRFLSQL